MPGMLSPPPRTIAEKDDDTVVVDREEIKERPRATPAQEAALTTLGRVGAPFVRPSIEAEKNRSFINAERVQKRKRFELFSKDPNADYQYLPAQAAAPPKKVSPKVNKSIDSSYAFVERNSPPAGRKQDRSGSKAPAASNNLYEKPTIQDLARSRRRPNDALRSRFYSRDRTKESKRSTPTQSKCSPIPTAGPLSSLPHKNAGTPKYEVLDRDDKVNKTVINSREGSSIISKHSGLPLLPALDISATHQPPPRDLVTALEEDEHGRAPSRISTNNNNNSYIEVNNSVIIVSNTPAGSYKTAGVASRSHARAPGRRVKQASAKRDLKCVCLSKEPGTKSGQVQDEEKKHNVLKSYLDSSIYPNASAAQPEPSSEGGDLLYRAQSQKGVSQKQVKTSIKRRNSNMNAVPATASANTSFECYASPSHQYPLFVKRRTPAGTSQALVAGGPAGVGVVLSPSAG